MRIKTTPTKSRKRTPVKSMNLGGGSVVSGSAFSNKPSATNVFSNAPSALNLNLEPIGRMADVPPPTFTPTKQVKTATNFGNLQHFYDEILAIDELLDLDNLEPPSNLVSQFGTPRPASGFTSMKVTPTKGTYSRQSAFTDFGPYLAKRSKAEKADFNDVEEGLRKKLIGWD
jgi:hypothetical protein